ncbi:MAG: hypothetical protein P8X96_04210 [Desulfobacteraceae bacterium]
MFSPSRRLIFLFLICGLIFMVGLVKLFLLRFEAGDVYPAYSSLRSDPLGTQALFLSLRRISTDAVSRNFHPLHEIELSPNTTLIVTGIGEGFWVWRASNEFEQLLENLAISGGRLVLTFMSPPQRHPLSWEKDKEKETSEDGASSGDAQGEGAQPESDTAEDRFDKQFGKTFDYDPHNLGFHFNTPTGEDWDDYAERFYGTSDILPPTIPWRAPLSFRLKDNSWETLYTWQGEPVVVQRPWGKGTVVMVADSYLLSNEALRNHRQTGVLTWLVQPGNAIVFDESLKGLLKQPGMAVLARQYRLHGVFAALLAVVGLFIWRQSTIFIAPVQVETGSGHSQPAAGRDTSQGLVHLARQHIDVKSLMTVCFKAWKGQAAQRVSAERISEVEALVAKAAADPRKEKQVKTYIEICELLRQGRHP